MAKKSEIEKVLTDLGKEITDYWKSFIRNHSDTGDLYGSVKYKVKDQILSLSMLDYGLALDKGRKAGKMPPISSIVRWAANKGLSPWGVAVNISKYGTKAYPFIDEYKSIVKEYKKNLTKAGRQDIVAAINKGIKIK